MDCDICKEHMKQYNRIWACSCGNFLPIKIAEDKVENYRYFPKNKNGFVINGKESMLKAPKCKDCNNLMKMINATDNASFYPRIIKSVNLIKNRDAELCKSKEGIELILKRKIGDVSKDEFEEKRTSIMTMAKDKQKIEMSVSGFDALLKNIKMNNKEEIFALQTDDENMRQ